MNQALKTLMQMTFVSTVLISVIIQSLITNFASSKQYIIEITIIILQHISEDKMETTRIEVLKTMTTYGCNVKINGQINLTRLVLPKDR